MSLQEIPPKKYFRRIKISAYLDQFMLSDGTMVNGERFTNIERFIDLVNFCWYDAETGEELNYTLTQELETKYQKNHNA